MIMTWYILAAVSIQSFDKKDTAPATNSAWSISFHLSLHPQNCSSRYAMPAGVLPITTIIKTKNGFSFFLL